MMKIDYLLSVFVCVVGFSLIARDVQETILRAHKIYEEGNVEKALELYNSIEKKGTATWYNIGNCHYKCGRYFDALICWRRAERDAIWGEFPAIYNNIDQAYRALGLHELSTIKSKLFRLAQRFFSLLSLFGWQLFFLCIWILLLLCLPRFACNRRYCSLSLMSFLVIMLATVVYVKSELHTACWAVVVNNNLVVYAGPDKGFHEVGSFGTLRELAVCEQHENWLKVRDHDLIGWIPREDVIIV